MMLDYESQLHILICPCPCR